MRGTPWEEGLDFPVEMLYSVVYPAEMRAAFKHVR